MEKRDGLVLALSAVLTSLLISIEIHYPTSNPSLYSDVVGSFWERCWVQSGILPYVGSAAGCSSSFEYPVLSGLLLYITVQVGSSLTGFYEVFSGLSLVAGAVLVYAVWGIAKKAGRTINPLYFMMPTFILYGIYNFDLFHAMFAVVSVFFFVRGNRVASASFLGLAVDTKLASVVLLPIFLMEVQGRRERAKYFGVFALAVAALNVPIMIFNFSNFLAGYQFLGNWGLEDAWYVWIFQNSNTWLWAKLFGLGVAGLLLVRVYTLRVDLVTKSFLAIAAYLLGTYIYAPQFNLLLIPFVVLLELKHPALYPWEGFNALIILTWFIPASNPVAAWSYPQIFALLRAACLAWMCVSVASAEGHSPIRWLRATLQRNMRGLAKLGAGGTSTPQAQEANAL